MWHVAGTKHSTTSRRAGVAIGMGFVAVVLVGLVALLATGTVSILDDEPEQAAAERPAVTTQLDRADGLDQRRGDAAPVVRQTPILAGLDRVDAIVALQQGTRRSTIRVSTEHFPPRLRP